LLVGIAGGLIGANAVSAASQKQFSLTCTYVEYSVDRGVRSETESGTLYFSFDLQKGLYAARLWGQFDGARKIAEITEEVITTYRTDRQTETINRFSGAYSWRFHSPGVAGYEYREGRCETRPYEPVPAQRF
jgi:hypothetical protein